MTWSVGTVIGSGRANCFTDRLAVLEKKLTRSNRYHPPMLGTVRKRQRERFVRPVGGGALTRSTVKVDLPFLQISHDSEGLGATE
jgi:hypothetical protein